MPCDDEADCDEDTGRKNGGGLRRRFRARWPVVFYGPSVTPEGKAWSGRGRPPLSQPRYVEVTLEAVGPEDETICPITQEPIGASLGDSGNDNDDMATLAGGMNSWPEVGGEGMRHYMPGRPDINGVALACGHRFTLMPLLYHWARNDTVRCPVCRQGMPGARLRQMGVPAHLRLGLYRRVRAERRAEQLEQIQADREAARRLADLDHHSISNNNNSSSNNNNGEAGHYYGRRMADEWVHMLTVERGVDARGEWEEEIITTTQMSSVSPAFTVWWEGGPFQAAAAQDAGMNAVLTSYELMRASDPEGAPASPPTMSVVLPYAAEPFCNLLRWCVDQLPRCCMELRYEEMRPDEAAWPPSLVLRDMHAHVIRSYPTSWNGGAPAPPRIRLVACLDPAQAEALRGRPFRLLGGVDAMRFQASRVLFPGRGPGYVDLSYPGFGQAVRYWVNVRDGAPCAVFFDVRLDAFMLLAMDPAQVQTLVAVASSPSGGAMHAIYL